MFASEDNLLQLSPNFQSETSPREDNISLRDNLGGNSPSEGIMLASKGLPK